MHYILPDADYPEWNKTWSTEREKLLSRSFHEIRSNSNHPKENLWPNTDPAFDTNHICSETTLWKTVKNWRIIWLLCGNLLKYFAMASFVSRALSFERPAIESIRYFSVITNIMAETQSVHRLTCSKWAGNYNNIMRDPTMTEDFHTRYELYIFKCIKFSQAVDFWICKNNEINKRS